MRFCDKLPKLRKDNNLSQEQLADRLGVSRQAVSKWESGQSYPDMDKMIQMCSILNCKLEDILDDGTIGSNGNNSKNNINSYFNDFLKFITKIYNMFCSMTFKQKIKCLLEMSFIAFLLFLLGMILFEMVDSLLLRLILNIPSIGNFFYNVIANVFIILLVIIGVIIFIHLFKVRYLDYYVTIEDSNASEKTIEEPIDKSKKNIYEESKQEKIIIRDPKHSSFSFFEFLVKIIIFGMKVICTFIAMFFVISFVLLAISLTVVLFHTWYGWLFIFIALALVGLLLINYDFLEVIYKFIISKGQSTKRVFITFILGLMLFGVGTGLAMTSIMSFEKDTKYAEDRYVTSYEEIIMDDNTTLDFYIGSNSINYVIDDSCDNIKLEIKHLKEVQYSLNNSDNYFYLEYNVWLDDAYKLIIADLKNKKIRDYDSSDFIMVNVIVSQENYDKLNSNYKNYVID